VAVTPEPVPEGVGAFEHVGGDEVRPPPAGGHRTDHPSAPTNGSDWFICGTPDPWWDDDDLDQLRRIPGSAFEVVRADGLERG
jgi:hypothetical protein